MKMLVHTVAFVFVLGGSMHVAAEPKRLTQAQGEKLLAFVNKFVDIAIRNQDKCPQMGTQLNKLIDANPELVRLATEPIETGRRPPKNIEDKMEARTKEMMPAIQKCASDKGVEKAFLRVQPRKS